MNPGDLVRSKTHGWTALLIEFEPFSSSHHGEPYASGSAGICTIQWVDGPTGLEGRIDKCHSDMIEILQEPCKKSAKD